MAVPKLTIAILVAALSRRATAIWIGPHAGDATRALVRFTIRGVEAQEMTPPADQLVPILDALAAMAGLPAATDGAGVIQLQAGAAHATFGLRRTAREAWLVVAG